MSPVADKPRYLSVGEVALELRVSKASIYRAVEAGTLPAIRLQPLGAFRSTTTSESEDLEGAER